MRWEHLKTKKIIFLSTASCFWEGDVRWELIFLPNVILITSQSCSHGENILPPDDATCSFKEHRQWKVKTAPSHMLSALWCSGRSWDSLQELLAPIEGGSTLCIWTRSTSVKNPSLIFPLHHLSEGRRCESIPPHLVPNNPSLLLLLLRTVVSGATAARRTGAEPEERVEERPATGERSYRRAGGGGSGSSTPLGIITLCTSPDASNMHVRSKGLAGITALVASMLLGSCGTGEKGERLRALSWGTQGFIVAPRL